MTPDTIPVFDPTVATAVLLLVQVPPEVRSTNVLVAPVQTVLEPDIDTGCWLMVIASVAEQPAGSVYIILTEPVTDPPVTIPLDDPTVAFVRSLLLHVPPVVASARFVVRPVHTVFEPVIATGVGLTVRGVLIIQPVGKV